LNNSNPSFSILEKMLRDYISELRDAEIVIDSDNIADRLESILANQNAQRSRT